MMAVAVAVCFWCLPGLAASTKTIVEGHLADLSLRVITCATHPCLGDEEDETSKLLADQIVTDGLFYYSDINVAYPETHGSLRGVVEWEFSDGSLDVISFKIVDFRSSTAVLISEIERTLPDCEIERDDEAGREWSCFATGLQGNDVLVEIYLAPNLVILEVGS